MYGNKKKAKAIVYSAPQNPEASTFGDNCHYPLMNKVMDLAVEHEKNFNKTRTEINVDSHHSYGWVDEKISILNISIGRLNEYLPEYRGFIRDGSVLAQEQTLDYIRKNALSVACYAIKVAVQASRAMAQTSRDLKKLEDKKKLDVDIKNLGFSEKTYWRLKRAGIESIDDLMAWSIADLMKLSNLDQKTKEEIILKRKDIEKRV